MQKITISPTDLQPLIGLKNQVLICDAEGYALGFFQPQQKSISGDDFIKEQERLHAEYEEYRQEFRRNYKPE